jgi:double-stranded uracil-DNA glycosylase
MIMSDYLVPDLLQPNLRLVFCGTAPSTKSAEEKSYYAKPGNKFWPTLYRVGITPHQFLPREYQSLLNFQIGLTDLCKAHSGTDAQLPKDAFDLNEFHEKIKRYRPKLVAFTSKNAARQVLGVQPQYGLQTETITHGVKQTKLFVLPSPSGLATRFFDITVWQALAQYVAKDLK